MRFSRLRLCAGVILVGPWVREGANALAQRKVCVPERRRAPQHGNTLMHQAAAGGNVAVVAKLLEKEAVKNEENTVCVRDRGVEERE